MLAALQREGQGCVDVVSEVAALSFFPPALFIFRIGVVWPTLVMRARVTVCLESQGNAVRACPWITAQPHRPLHSHCLLRLHLDCKSQALLTHLCCLSPRLMAITSVCFFSEGEGKLQESNALLKTGKSTDSWWRADSLLWGELLLLILQLGDYFGWDVLWKNGLMVAGSQ